MGSLGNTRSTNLRGIGYRLQNGIYIHLMLWSRHKNLDPLSFPPMGE